MYLVYIVNLCYELEVSLTKPPCLPSDLALFSPVQTLMYSVSQFLLLMRQCGPPKYWYESTKLHGLVSQRMVIAFVYVTGEEVYGHRFSSKVAVWGSPIFIYFFFYQIIFYVALFIVLEHCYMLR